MNKSLLLQRLQYERDKFELLLNRIGFARQLTMKGVSGNLSIKDLLADILSREQFIADRLTEIVHGETYSPCTSYTALQDFQSQYGYPDYESPLMEKDAPEHLVMEKHKNIALDEIVSQELAVYANIVDAIRELTHHQFLDHDLFHRIAIHTYKPYRRLSTEIQLWRKRIGTSAD
jgi:hypothetical protein